MRPILCFIAIAPLAACSPDRAWVDGTGQNRGYDAMHADNVACYNGEMPKDIAHTSQDQIRAAFARIDLCMQLNGWIHSN